MSVPFQSPLFRLRRAPLLQVFVPSPDGDWLSDTSVLECEAELKRAGVLHLMRAGDVVWDVAVGDEANVGRLIWDGNYLIVSLPSAQLYDLLVLTNTIGPRLLVLKSGGCTAIPTYAGVPPVVFPPRNTDDGDRKPNRAHRYLALG